MPAPDTLRHRLLLGLLALYLVVSVAAVAYESVRTDVDNWKYSDFNAFYRAAQLATRPYRAELYNLSATARVRPPYSQAIGAYFEPPLLALAVYGPLTVFSYETARVAFAAVIVLASLGMVGLAYAWSRRSVPTLVALLAVASYLPLLDTLRYGQPSALFALVSGAALLAMQSGRLATSGLLVSLLALKPSLSLLPLGLVAWLGKGRAIVAAGAWLVVFVLLPFLFIGPGAFSDYEHLLTKAQEDAFTMQGGITAGAPFMFNWNGFIARLFQVAPSTAIVFPLYALTILLMARVWLRGDLAASWLAATLATLLAVPHLLGYDWILLLPVCIAFAISRPTVPVIGLLVLLHLSVNVSDYQLLENSLYSHQAVLVATPAAFLLLLYVAFEPEMEALAARVAGRAAEAPSLAVP